MHSGSSALWRLACRLNQRRPACCRSTALEEQCYSGSTPRLFFGRRLTYFVNAISGACGQRTTIGWRSGDRAPDDRLLGPFSDDSSRRRGWLWLRSVADLGLRWPVAWTRPLSRHCRRYEAPADECRCQLGLTVPSFLLVRGLTLGSADCCSQRSTLCCDYVLVELC